jgi:hypothetical protein
VANLLGLRHKPITEFFALLKMTVALGFKSPAAMPSNADESGVFGEDCLRVENPSSAAA